jgi:hypothetical protein
MAWISNHNGPGPNTRFTNPIGPYIRVDGSEVSPSWSDLITVPWTIERPINLTAGGVQITPGQRTWTNTYANGQWASNNYNNTCQDWTSSLEKEDEEHYHIGHYGYADETSAYWSAYNFATCNNEYRFYCFQQSVP